MQQNITISVDEYEKLLADSHKLAALEGAGVDNWSGYGDAMEMLEEMKAEMEQDEEVSQ